MNFRFELSDQDRELIRIIDLVQNYNKRSYLWDIWRVLESIEAGPKNFDRFVKTVGGQSELPRPLEGRPRPRELLKHLEGLGFVGLLSIISHPSEHQSFMPYVSYGQEPERYDYEVDIILSEEGKRVAGAIHGDRIVQVRKPKVERSTIFIACAIGKRDINQWFNSEIVPACNMVGLDPIRVDLEEPEGTITQAILDGISDSACLVGDLTYARPSVYYELGYAQGLGVPIVLSCRQDHREGKSDRKKIHFDIITHKISLWEKMDSRFVWETGMAPKDRLKKLLS